MKKPDRSDCWTMASLSPLSKRILSLSALLFLPATLVGEEWVTINGPLNVFGDVIKVGWGTAFDSETGQSILTPSGDLKWYLFPVNNTKETLTIDIQWEDYYNINVTVPPQEDYGVVSPYPYTLPPLKDVRVWEISNEARFGDAAYRRYYSLPLLFESAPTQASDDTINGSHFFVSLPPFEYGRIRFRGSDSLLNLVSPVNGSALPPNEVIKLSATSKLFAYGGIWTCWYTWGSTLGGDDIRPMIQGLPDSIPYYLNGFEDGRKVYLRVFARPETTFMDVANNGITWYYRDFDFTTTNTKPGGDTAISQWRQIFFGNPNNNGNGADLNDFDNDGLVNLIEYAQGSSPIDSASAFRPIPGLESNGGQEYLTLTIPKAAWANDVTRTIEVAGNLGQWKSSADQITVLEDNPTILKVRANTPATQGSRSFIRLRVTVP